MLKFAIAVLATGIMYDKNSNKPDCAIKKSGHAQLGKKCKLHSATSTTGQSIYKKKKSVYM